ncbi:MAG: glycosyltransferase family 39 protein [Nitrospirota bacterium]|nr:glycosyltransferase family 39 protein [Nitrospirota bacterium]
MNTNSARTKKYLLIGIIVIAAILRLNHINQPLVDAFSWRQSSTAMMADNFYNKNWNIFYPEVSWGGPGPNYQGREFQTVSYLAALLYTVFGQHDWIGRGIPVIFGLWGLFALYQLVRRIWDEQRALASAAVMALLPGSIFIERSFLPDPAMVALITTSLWLLVACLQTGLLRYLLLSGLTGTLGYLSKLPGLIIGLPMIYATLSILKGQHLLRPKKIAAMTAFAVLTILPAVAYYLWARHLALSYPPHHFAGSGNWLWDGGLQNWLGQNYFLARMSERFANWIWTAPVIALVFTGLIILPPGTRQRRTSGDSRQRADSPVKAPWLFHWWMLACVIYYFIGARELVENPWNFHIINPAASALAGHAIISIASGRRHIFFSPSPAAVTAVLLLVIFAFGQRGLRWMYHPYAHESYKLGLALREISEPGDLVVTVSNSFAEPTAIYYSKRRGWVFPPAFAWDREPLKDGTEDIRLFEELRSRGADWIGIVSESLARLRQNHSALVEHISSTCRLESENRNWVIYRILPPDEIRQWSGSSGDGTSLTLNKQQVSSVR